MTELVCHPQFMNVFVSGACFLGTKKKTLDLPTSKFVSFILKSKGLYGFAEKVLLFLVTLQLVVVGLGWELLS